MVVGGASLLSRASIGERENVPEKSRLRCSDLCRLCVCRILDRVLRPRDSARGGKLLTFPFRNGISPTLRPRRPATPPNITATATGRQVRIICQPQDSQGAG